MTDQTASALNPVSTAGTDDDRRLARSAPVRDPLWLLARQWQTGEFVAGDGGSPVRVRLATACAPLRRDGVPVTAALAAAVEAEPLEPMSTVDTAARAGWSAELLRRIRDAGISGSEIARLRRASIAAYPLTPASAPPSAGVADAFSTRWPDAARLAADLIAATGPDGSGGSVPALPGVDARTALASALEPVVRGWLAWVSRQAAPAGPADAADHAEAVAPPAWDAVRLQYGVEVSADLTPGSLALQARDYDGLGLDWFSFDRGTLPGVPGGSAAAVEVRPAPVTYPGMPQPRYWMLEDGEVNLDAELGAGPAHALLAQFAHGYSNDWFLVPVGVGPGACLVTRLEVTDTFGSVTTVRSTAEADGPARRWRMWELTLADGAEAAGGDAARSVRVFLPPSPTPLEGDPVEDVLVARDELANLAWLIELTSRDRDGRTVDRARRWLALRPADDPAVDPGGRAGGGSYRLGTPLPDHWYPLVTAATGTRALVLAELPEGASEVTDDGVRGHAVPHTPATRLADEEASRTGTRVTRVDRLGFGPSGRLVWRARTRRPATGEVSSALRFDVLR